jgi:hypothetical protein
MFHVATAEEVKSGEVTDVYFRRAAAVLRELPSPQEIRRFVLEQLAAEFGYRAEAPSA